MRRRFADLLLFSVTLAELIFLVEQTPTFTLVDWIYVSQHLWVLGIAFARRSPEAHDHSLTTSVAVAISYAYPYAQILALRWVPGDPVSPTGGLVLVTIAAVLSAASLLSLGRSFGIRPALRQLVWRGPYRVVRHPMYLSYVISDIGYNLQEWNSSTVLLVLAGWLSLIYRIHAEERVLSRSPGWPAYVAAVPSRLIPHFWPRARPASGSTIATPTSSSLKGRGENSMGLRDKYDQAIQTAKQIGMQGSAEERDGKLYFRGTVNTQQEANRIWDAIKTVPDWPTEVVADVKATGAAAPAAAAASATYTVKPGDTLSRIAKQTLGDANAYMDIFNANRDLLSDPDKITPGQVLKIPQLAKK